MSSPDSTLQQEFMDIVHKMIETGTPLPKEFELFFVASIHTDGESKFVSTTAFLTEDEAISAKSTLSDSHRDGGKYSWYTRTHSVCTSTDLDKGHYEESFKDDTAGYDQSQDDVIDCEEDYDARQKECHEHLTFGGLKHRTTIHIPDVD